MTKILIVMVVLLLLVGGTYLFLKFKAPTPTTVASLTPSPSIPPVQVYPSSETVSPRVTPPESAQEVLVKYTDSGYIPNVLNIKIGTIVNFVNSSSRAMWTASGIHPTHMLYSGTSMVQHCPDPKNVSFDACDGTKPGSSWSFKITKTGNWMYHNHLVPSDTGRITVTQ